ncbi:unnamed protein product [Pleuronectes platessa]|uniref:Uncharacterized protein n=1 Tax=Pleuronectes platessa TaxID=8262 RepID=A0A9N7TMF6_PLEPL|nr:unnamed protein product [Pleuronectes platessa]
MREDVTSLSPSLPPSLPLPSDGSQEALELYYRRGVFSTSPLNQVFVLEYRGGPVSGRLSVKDLLGETEHSLLYNPSPRDSMSEPALVLSMVSEQLRDRRTVSQQLCVTYQRSQWFDLLGLTTGPRVDSHKKKQLPLV